MSAGAAAKAADGGLGWRGEELAARYLGSLGCSILERRWRPKHLRSGEIDLVVRDGSEIVFVEVKSRLGGGFGQPEEAVTAAKRDRLRRTAQAFLQERGLADRPWRIDVIAVLSVAPGRACLRHLRSAVGEED